MGSWSDVNKNRWERIRDLMQLGESRRQHGWGMLQQGIQTGLGLYEAGKERELKEKLPGITAQAQAEADLQKYSSDPYLTFERNKSEWEAEGQRIADQKAAEWLMSPEGKDYREYQLKLKEAGRESTNIYGSVKDVTEGIASVYDTWAGGYAQQHPEADAYYDSYGKLRFKNMTPEVWDKFRSFAIKSGLPEGLVDAYIEGIKLETPEAGGGGGGGDEPPPVSRPSILQRAKTLITGESPPPATMENEEEVGQYHEQQQQVELEKTLPEIIDSLLKSLPLFGERQTKKTLRDYKRDINAVGLLPLDQLRTIQEALSRLSEQLNQ